MGRGDLRDFLKVKNVECAALCDVDESQIAKAAKEILEPALAAAPSLKTSDFRKVLDMKELEAVIVATPDHWHALPTVMACQAGKDVYVENLFPSASAKAASWSTWPASTIESCRWGPSNAARRTIPKPLTT
jgi:hypothetical protein